MARLVWGAPTERYYEMGVDNGVLFVGSDPGVAWTGLVSVDESPSGGDPRPAYIDGIKYSNISKAEEFEATIQAFAAPAEFGPCEGRISIQNGLFATQQKKRAFSFSYRTRVGNALAGSDFGYKIHLVYNALVAPTTRSNKTLGRDSELNTLSWSITTLPPSLTGMKPTAHFIIDSRYTPRGLLAAVEDILYGSDLQQSRIPQVSELLSMFKSEGPLIATNLLTNPTFRYSSATQVIRRNLAKDPCATAAPPGGGSGWTPLWFGAGGAGTSTYETGLVDGPYGITTFARKTWTQAPTGNGDTGFSHNVGNYNQYLAASVGEVYSVSSYLRTNSTGNRARIRFTWYDSAGAIIRNGYGGVYNLLPNTWTRLSGTDTAPTGAVYLCVWSDVMATAGVVWAVGDTLDGTGLMYEQGAAAALPYFDGIRRPRLRVNEVVDPQGTKAGWSALNISIVTAPWDSSRTCVKSVSDGVSTLYVFSRITPRSWSNGQTVTVSATVQGPAGRYGSIRAIKRSPVTYYGSSYTGSPRFVFTGEPQRVAITTTLTEDLGEKNLAAAVVATSTDTSGALPSGEEVFVGDVLIEEAPIEMPYFDGDFSLVTENSMAYAWSGTAKDTVSYQYNPDWSVSWSGTANASEAIETAPYIPTGNLMAYAPVTGGRVGTDRMRLLMKKALSLWAFQSAGYTLCSAGEHYAWRLQARLINGTEIVTVRPQLGFYNPQFLNYLAIETVVDLPISGEWVDLRPPSGGAVPSDGGSVRLMLYSVGSAKPGTIIEVRRVLLQKTNDTGILAGAYFDGDTIDSDNNYYSWTGTPNTSTSELHSWN